MELHLARLKSERVAFVGDWPPCALPPDLAADHPLARALHLHAIEASRPAVGAETERRAVALRALDDLPIFRLRLGSRANEVDAPTLRRALLDEIDAGKWPLAPPAAFNHLAATRELAEMGALIDVVRLGPGLVPTRELEADDERRLDEWLEEHGHGYECGRGGCTEHHSFEPLAADVLRLFALLPALTAIERRLPGSLAKAGVLAALATIARVERHPLLRYEAEAAVKLAGEPVDPRALERDNPPETARLREFEELRYAIDPPLDALARVVDSEQSGPALCAACILLERDLAAHAERVFAFVRGFPPRIDERRDRGEAVPPLHGAPHVLHHRPRQFLADRGEQVGVVAEPHRQRAPERADPLSVPDGGQHVVDQERRAPCEAQREGTTGRTESDFPNNEPELCRLLNHPS